MLGDLGRAVLVAIDRLTRDTYGQTDGAQIIAEFKAMGHEPPDIALLNLMRELKRDGYIEGYAAMGTTATAFHMVSLTSWGREEAREADPFERVLGEARHLLGSSEFAAAYPGAFEAWAAAERLLRAEDAASNLTTVGHRVREAMQAFATAMVEEHRPPNVDPNVANVEKRLGAVIAMHRGQLGDARREALEALGTLWNKVSRLVQRQEHGGQKEGEPVTWSDARRIVYLTMFCMVEFVDTFEDLPPPPVARVEGG